MTDGTINGHDAEVIVVAYRSRTQVEQLLAGLPEDLPVAVVDNSDGSDGLRDVVLARPRGRYLAGGGVGFSRAATAGARSSEADVLVFVNPDTRPTPEDLAALVDDVTGDPTCGASAAVLVEDDGRAQIGVAGWEPTLARAVVHGLGLHKLAPTAGLFARPRLFEPLQVDWVSGAVMAVRREVFEQLGGFDPDFYVYNEDMAFGRQCREHGLPQRLRTDLPISGASGGSGAPSLEMTRLKGASMRRYLGKFHHRPAATLIATAYAFGYAVRAAERALRRDVPRAREHWSLVLGAVTGRATVGGRVVTGG